MGGRRGSKDRKGMIGFASSLGICYPSSLLLSAAYRLCVGDCLITLKHFSCPVPGFRARPDGQELPWPLSPSSFSSEALQASPARNQTKPNLRRRGWGKPTLGLGPHSLLLSFLEYLARGTRPPRILTKGRCLSSMSGVRRYRQYL